MSFLRVGAASRSRKARASRKTSSPRARSGGRARLDHRHPVVEVVAEAALLHRRLEVGVGRRRSPARRRSCPAVRPPAGPCAPAGSAAASPAGRRGSSPISSRNSVPPWASSMRPLRWAWAPVNEPFSWPNSSLSSRFSGMAPQLMATNGPSARAPSRWMARATSSLPVPLSPRTSTAASVAASLRTAEKTCCMASLVPIRSSSPSAAEPPLQLAVLALELVELEGPPQHDLELVHLRRASGSSRRPPGPPRSARARARRAR